MGGGWERRRARDRASATATSSHRELNDARGLAVDTGIGGKPEEFPHFRAFWLLKPSANAKDMTVWYLQEDRSRFEEGSLNHGENSHSDPTPAVHG